ncbi:hypothetical protein MPTK1_1g03190 [Marchantia polymorpha subsp. ruderalis]|uniref:Uncharacterized protein n=2 Tax=Marchantia polymorpha TaxID=3197 RepID=A0AAF6AL05_MARPO|nr:hypothetical protein MARPO_0005s0288 [Marchantia polymorpha]BBM97125.1 hypothetical protein Mp_1g03190 [Marchantia polymorpha subsp. ruderalis]|eukprot:PTQ48680.1 hypothetical protein MARPO_0005s0288 [Marchantia polymorpha]
MDPSNGKIISSSGVEGLKCAAFQRSLRTPHHGDSKCRIHLRLFSCSTSLSSEVIEQATSNTCPAERIESGCTQ